MPRQRVVQRRRRGCAALALTLALALGAAVCGGAAGARVSSVTVSEGSGGAMVVVATVDADGGGGGAAGATLRYTLGFSKEERSVNMTHAGCARGAPHAAQRARGKRIARRASFCADCCHLSPPRAYRTARRAGTAAARGAAR
jgi:hypothetical protein